MKKRQKQKRFDVCVFNKFFLSIIFSLIQIVRILFYGMAVAFRCNVPVSVPGHKQALEDFEKSLILKILKAYQWNRQKAARELGITRNTPF